MRELVCDICGKTFIYKGGEVHFKRNKTHRCSRACQNIKHGYAKRKYKGNIEGKIYQIWSSASKRSKIKKIDFNIKPSDITIPEKCPLLGIKIELNNKNLQDNSPSLDRIDNKKGYIKNNVWVISNKANRIKSDSTFEEFERVYKQWKNLK